jgi:hypothetical protein
MDDAGRSRVLKTATIAGLLVLLGAGCVAGPETKQAGAGNLKRTSEERSIATSTEPRVLLIAPNRVCISEINTNGFISEFERLQGVQPHPKVIDALRKEEASGWMVYEGCYDPAKGNLSEAYVFSLGKMQGVTEDEARSIVRAVSFSDQKLRATDFTGGVFWSLNKFLFIGDAFADADVGSVGVKYSPLFAVNGGPNQVGFLSALSMSRDISTPIESTIVRAQASGGDQDVYDADIVYTPRTNALKFQICRQKQVGENLGEKTIYTCN